MSEARDAILSVIRRSRAIERPVPAYAFPVLTNDLAALFAHKARAAEAEVHEIGSVADLPLAVWALLPAERRSQLHIPAQSPLRALEWHRAPGLTLESAPPSGEDTALSKADFAIAETGTLVFVSGAASPSSWHFRPGTEMVLVRRANILPRFEDLAGRVAASGIVPATVNCVTGPSRTADIEQTIELGAHGPRSLQILIAD